MLTWFVCMYFNAIVFEIYVNDASNIYTFDWVKIYNK